MKNGKNIILIALISVGIIVLISLAYLFDTQFFSPEKLSFIPSLNAFLNSISFLSLLMAFYFIKQKNTKLHVLFIFSALFFTGLFLISYLIYHFTTPHTEFQGQGWVRYLYFFLLITHVVLAAIILPLVLYTLSKAIQKDFGKHKKIARITLPLWLYVSITGVLIYFFNAPYYT